MTAPTIDAGTETNTGRVARVIGPVLDVEVPSDSMPEIYNALLVDTEVAGTKETLTLEVAQHIGDGMVRAISLRPTDGVVRGSTPRRTVVDLPHRRWRPKPRETDVLLASAPPGGDKDEVTDVPQR